MTDISVTLSLLVGIVLMFIIAACCCICCCCSAVARCLRKIKIAIYGLGFAIKCAFIRVVTSFMRPRPARASRLSAAAKPDAPRNEASRGRGTSKQSRPARGPLIHVGGWISDGSGSNSNSISDEGSGSGSDADEDEELPRRQEGRQHQQGHHCVKPINSRPRRPEV